MKVVYCLMDSTSSGEIERSVCCKANYLADVVGYEVTILTTDKKNESNFYEFSPKIKLVNLEIDYSDVDDMSFFVKRLTLIKKKKLHKERLATILLSLKPDITISTYGHEFSLLAKLQHGGKKIVEMHFCRSYKKIEYNNRSRGSLKRIFTLLTERKKQSYIKKYDSVIVPTKKDKEEWGNSSNIEILPSPASLYPAECAKYDIKRVISVGQLSSMNHYNLLVEAWSQLITKHSDWKLSIYGDGEEKVFLEGLIKEKGIYNQVSICSDIPDLEIEYIKSSIFITPYLYTACGLTIMDAMACGLPSIMFNCWDNDPQGVLRHGEDGLLVKGEDINKLSDAILLLIEDQVLRKEMGENARENVQRFLPERVMPRWVTLFEQVTGTSEY